MPTDIAAFALILMGVTLFSLYWFIAGSDAFEALVRQRIDPTGIKKPLAQKGLGVLLLGVLPASAVWMEFEASPVAWGMGMPDGWATLAWGGWMTLVALTVPFFSARSADMQAYYPQIRAQVWDFALFAQSGLAWMAYLLAYEYLYRGVLVLGLASLTSPWLAMAISSALATATHLPKGGKETFATIPYSLLLGYVALESGSIWAGYVCHAALAIANDYWALRHNPDMRLVRVTEESRQRAPVP